MLTLGKGLSYPPRQAAYSLLNDLEEETLLRLGDLKNPNLRCDASSIFQGRLPRRERDLPLLLLGEVANTRPTLCRLPS
ncbi:uncharacterized protein L3040_007981 [Drepanopeziza brunnea f. sp. 'multigermtubi']|uniref:uncharacterized protein n=1 Tax=Drepanopeziza brunnea f. sp. 'multigermtubi' TaxID=698441 RepID=UPI00238F9C41|nr:hypothetical protein L3040_007981 [Drepanopeziza brunnea f. sp. 'multigermtubi']